MNRAKKPMPVSLRVRDLVDIELSLSVVPIFAIAVGKEAQRFRRTRPELLLRFSSFTAIKV
jgi:hypothetical protein